jgi:hypothetical protein
LVWLDSKVNGLTGDVMKAMKADMFYKLWMICCGSISAISDRIFILIFSPGTRLESSSLLLETGGALTDSIQEVLRLPWVHDNLSKSSPFRYICILDG